MCRPLISLNSLLLLSVVFEWIPWYFTLYACQFNHDDRVVVLIEYKRSHNAFKGNAAHAFSDHGCHFRVAIPEVVQALCTPCSRDIGYDIIIIGSCP